MLDQNLTTLLAAIIGGLLTIAGGFIASYYVQKTSFRKDKRKELRDIFENLYRETFTMGNLYRSWIEHLKAGFAYDSIETRKIDNELFLHLNNIKLLVDLYVPSLKSEIDEYYKSFSEPVVEVASVKIDDKQKLDELNEKANIATRKFCIEILNLLKKEGYSYF